MILRPVRPASPWGPPITKRPEGWIYQESEEKLRGACKWTYVVDGSFVKEVSRDDLLDDLLLDLPAEILS